MIPEIQAGLSAAKASFELAKAIKGVSDAVQINAIVIELQEKILSAQEALVNAQEKITALVRENNELEARNAKKSDWEKLKSKYQLTLIRPGLTAYTFHPVDETDGPAHWACPHCFAKEELQILQKRSPGNLRYSCPACEFDMVPDAALPKPRIIL